VRGRRLGEPELSRLRDGLHKTLTLDAPEFIRRFLLHVLPTELMRVRHYGLLANR